jgi:single-strand DNA-binding protein
MMDLNQVVLIGRMTDSIKIREVGEHKAGEFSLAVNGYKDKEASFINCKVWNKTAELLEKYTHKGSKISVVGKLVQERWESEGKKQSKIIVNIMEVQFLDPKKDETKPASQPEIPEWENTVPF